MDNIYKVAVSHNSGETNTLIDNEDELREFIKLNRDHHMEVFYNDDIIYEIHTLLPYEWIDHLDFSGNTYLKF